MKNSEQITLLRAEIEALKARVALLELQSSLPVWPGLLPKPWAPIAYYRVTTVGTSQ